VSLLDLLRYERAAEKRRPKGAERRLQVRTMVLLPVLPVLLCTLLLVLTFSLLQIESKDRVDDIEYTPPPPPAWDDEDDARTDITETDISSMSGASSVSRTDITGEIKEKRTIVLLMLRVDSCPPVCPCPPGTAALGRLTSSLLISGTTRSSRSSRGTRSSMSGTMTGTGTDLTGSGSDDDTATMSGTDVSGGSTMTGTDLTRSSRSSRSSRR